MLATDYRKAVQHRALSDRELMRVLLHDEAPIYMATAEAIFTDCDSPIERQLLLAFLQVLLMTRPAALGTTVLLELQPKIVIDDDLLRPDALIRSTVRKEALHLLIEADGWKYHGDVASFTADRQRDRRLLAAGYQVVRFSGHEIAADPRLCAWELLALVGIKGETTE